MSRRGGQSRGRTTVLCVAGADSAGCSGIAADLRTVAALGGHGMVALTAVTAQSARELRAVAPVAPSTVRAQIDAAFEAAAPGAVKVGMLATAPVARAVAAALGGRGGAPLVVDPVLFSTTGAALLDEAGQRVLVERLLPIADLLTPNLREAEALLGRPVRGLAGMAEAARRLRGLGAKAVLVKGGHRRGGADDVYVDAAGEFVLRGPRFATANTRGTGCVLSTAIACFLAQGLPTPEAVRRAKAFVAIAIRHSYALGSGRGPVDPLAAGRRCLGRRTA